VDEAQLVQRAERTSHLRQNIGQTCRLALARVRPYPGERVGAFHEVFHQKRRAGRRVARQIVRAHHARNAAPCQQGKLGRERRAPARLGEDLGHQRSAFVLAVDHAHHETLRPAPE